MENEIVYIKLDDIIPNRFQPREVFDEKALNELSDSIRQHGVIQPITVRPVDNKYEIIAGERRYKASALAGLTKIPCIIRNLNDKESSILAYIENAQRKDVSPIEEARTSERILKTNNMTQEDLAKEIGISQSSLANKLRLLSLPLEVQESLMKNEISERHARSLLSVKNPEQQIELLNKIKNNRMTVRELDGEIKNMYGNSNVNMNADSVNNNFYSNNYVPKNQFIPNDNATNDGTSNQFIQNVNDNFNTSNMSFNKPIDTFNNNLSNNNFENDYLLDQNALSNKQSNENFINDNNNDNEGFIDFLNNFDETKYELNSNATTSPTTSDTSEFSSSNSDFSDFLNNFDETKYNLNNSSVIDENNIIGRTPNNPTLANTNPPITSNFSLENNNEYKYVEDNPNYSTVDKPKKITTIEGVIAELQIAVNKIKDSNFKIDTDEINFDDSYQITIKIDKKGVF